MIKLTIFGEPIPQARPRFTRNGHAYDPERSKNYKQLARLWITQTLKKYTGWEALETALVVDMTFYLSIPISWTKKRRIDASNGVIRPTAKNGDIDNLIKAVLDAGNGLIWIDDTFITDVYARKRYTADVARVEITVQSVKQEENKE